MAVDASTPSLRRRLETLARDLGARPKRVEGGQRVLYHAAAVFASNYVVAVMTEAVKILTAIGWSEKDAAGAVVPLADGVIANIREHGLVRALTGPIRRGEADTVTAHIRALNELDHKPPIEAVYRMLGQVALEIAREAGLDPAAAERTKRALTRNVAATRRRSG